MLSRWRWSRRSAAGSSCLGPQTSFQTWPFWLLSFPNLIISCEYLIVGRSFVPSQLEAPSPGSGFLKNIYHLYFLTSRNLLVTPKDAHVCAGLVNPPCNAERGTRTQGQDDACGRSAWDACAVPVVTRTARNGMSARPICPTGAVPVDLARAARRGHNAHLEHPSGTTTWNASHTMVETIATLN